MFKLSKGTHFTIIGTFAVVFIVIYLYYTITDVRRLQVEVSMLSKKVASLQPTPQEPTVVAAAPSVSSPPVIFLNTPGNVCVDDICKMVVDNDADGDASSVETVEVKKILSMCQEESEDAHDNSDDQFVEVDMTSEPVADPTPPVPEKVKVTRGRKSTK